MQNNQTREKEKNNKTTTTTTIKQLILWVSENCTFSGKFYEDVEWNYQLFPEREEFSKNL